MTEHSNWGDEVADEAVSPAMEVTAVAEPVEVGELPTLGEVLDSLTGFDEVAIEVIFKSHLEALSGIRLFRAGAFTLLRRQKIPDAEAFRTAMALPSREVQAMFRKDDPEAEQGDDEDGDDAGKA